MVDNGGTESPGGRAFGKEGRILFSLCGAFQEHHGSVISSHSETVIEPIFQEQRTLFLKQWSLNPEQIILLQT